MLKKSWREFSMTDMDIFTKMLLGEERMSKIDDFHFRFFTCRYNPNIESFQLYHNHRRIKKMENHEEAIELYLNTFYID